MAEWYEILIPVVALITALVALGTIFYLKKQVIISQDAFKESKTAYQDSRKAYEFNIIFQLNEILRGEKNRKISYNIARELPILKTNKGDFEYFELFDYLNVLHEITYMIDEKIIRKTIATRLFGALFYELSQNKEAMGFIHTIQEDQSKEAWGGLTIMIKIVKEFFDAQVPKSKPVDEKQKSN